MQECGALPFSAVPQRHHDSAMHTSSASWLCFILHAGINQVSAQGYVAEMRYINGDSGDLPNAKIPPLTRW